MAIQRGCDDALTWELRTGTESQTRTRERRSRRDPMPMCIPHHQNALLKTPHHRHNSYRFPSRTLPCELKRLLQLRRFLSISLLVFLSPYSLLVFLVFFFIARPNLATVSNWHHPLGHFSCCFVAFVHTTSGLKGLLISKGLLIWP